MDAGAYAGHAAAGHGPQALFAMEVASYTAQEHCSLFGDQALESWWGRG